MKIKSPLTDKSETQALCEAGADELFCGIVPLAWQKDFKDFCMNQRFVTSNFTEFSELEKAIRIAHRYKTRVHIAINAFFYLQEQYAVAQSVIREALNIGADGLILVDPALLVSIDKRSLRGKEVILGCDAVVFNSEAVDFYRELGVTRIVLPRSMSLPEIGELVRCRPDMEYEVFIINDLCFFEDGLCAFCKDNTGNLQDEGVSDERLQFFSCARLPVRGASGGCRSVFSRRRLFLKKGRTEKVEGKFRFWDFRHVEGCGACAIYDLKRMGIASLKVLDRDLPLEQKVHSTAFIKKAARLLDDGKLSRVDYTTRCRGLFKQTFKVKCSSYDCYYPLCK